MSNNNHNLNSSDPETLSHIRQQLSQLSNEHKLLVDLLIDSDEMIIGSFFLVYKTCTKPNCCCQKGKKHGPFAAISYSSNGHIHHKIVRELDSVDVERSTKKYKAFQKRRKKLREVQKKINELLDTVKLLQSREYQ